MHTHTHTAQLTVSAVWWQEVQPSNLCYECKYRTRPIKPYLQPWCQTLSPLPALLFFSSLLSALPSILIFFSFWQALLLFIFLLNNSLLSLRAPLFSQLGNHFNERDSDTHTWGIKIAPLELCILYTFSIYKKEFAVLQVQVYWAHNNGFLFTPKCCVAIECLYDSGLQLHSHWMVLPLLWLLHQPILKHKIFQNVAVLSLDVVLSFLVRS